MTFNPPPPPTGVLGNILLADDDAELLSIGGLILREAGYHVTSTNNGADAVARLGDTPRYDLLILDLRMPRGGGDAVIRSLGPSAPPVIIITGNQDMMEASNMSHVVRVLAKPFTMSELLEAVSDVLLRHRPPAAPTGHPDPARLD